MMSKVASAYSSSAGTHPFIKIFLAIIILLTVGLFLENSSSSNSMISKLTNIGGKKALRLLTWNIAAINNNPFEYWITSDDSGYNKIMKSVAEFIEQPAAKDVPINQVFTDSMASELFAEMERVGWSGVKETKEQWESSYKGRKIISEFVKDSVLGKKRLASMPDRVTNTINTVNEGIVTRPTVINCYNGGDLGTTDKWWTQWKQFMFHKEVSIMKKGEQKVTSIYSLISPIKKAKYPAITEEEEKISIPLQTLCAAIFDAILVHMMNDIDPHWQPLREDMCNKLNRKKHERTMDILAKTYSDAHVQFLQEVASSFLQTSKGSTLSKRFDIYSPANMDTDRDQNSFILLKKNTFVDVNEVTAEVLKEVAALAAKKVAAGGAKTEAPIMNGDLLAITAVDPNDHVKYLLASFHGDTNGLATKTIVQAVHSYAMNIKPDHKLLFGLDANTYASPEADQQGVTDFGQFFSGLKLNSCYGQSPDPHNFTTFHARTYLQPQLNKAITFEQKDAKGDKNPKDFILFFQSDFKVLSTAKDNTGRRQYIENMVFPTLSFPSDHGITSTVLLEGPSEAELAGYVRASRDPR